MSSEKKKQSRRQRRRVPRSLALNEMMLLTRWEAKNELSSGTSGTISATYSPSIQQSSEYSTLQNLFVEVKLVRCTVTFTGIAVTNTSVEHGRMWCGTNYSYTFATFTNPTNAAGAQNTTRCQRIPTYLTRAYQYNYPVPPKLDYSLITADSPTTPTPWAGSPGAIVVWAEALSASTKYFNVDFSVVYHLRGRQ